MNAKKCDRCGKFYEEYGTQKNKTVTNSVVFANTDINKKFWVHDPIELCPECMKEIKDFVIDGGKSNENTSN